MITLADLNKEDQMEKCGCNRSMAIYYCKEESCPNKETNPTYCIICSEEWILHKHATIRIVKEVVEIGN